MCLRINPINNVNCKRITRVKRQNEQQVQNPCFKSDAGDRTDKNKNSF